MVVFVIAEARSLKTLADGDILVVIDVTPVLILPTLDVGRVILWVLAVTLAGRVVVLNDYACAILTHARRTGSTAVGSCVLLPSRRYGLCGVGSSGNRGGGGSGGGSGGGGGSSIRSRSSRRSSCRRRFFLGFRPGSCLCVAFEGMLSCKLSRRGKPVELCAPLATRPIELCGNVRHASLESLAFLAFLLFALLSAALVAAFPFLLVLEEGCDASKRVASSKLPDRAQFANDDGSGGHGGGKGYIVRRCVEPGIE